MPEAALDGVDPFTSFLETLNDFRDIVRVDVSQTELTILVVLAYCVDVSLLADEEAKVVAAADPADLDRITEGHLDWVADFLPAHGEWPSERLASLTASQC